MLVDVEQLPAEFAVEKEAGWRFAEGAGAKRTERVPVTDGFRLREKNGIVEARIGNLFLLSFLKWVEQTHLRRWSG